MIALDRWRETVAMLSHRDSPKMPCDLTPGVILDADLKISSVEFAALPAWFNRGRKALAST